MSESSEALGQRLKAERVRKGLSCQKAADELHLDCWVIEGLESGDYARIGPSVYAKGHLKRYAELLGLPAAEILDSFAGQPSAAAPSTQPATMRLRTSAPAGSELPWTSIGGAAVAAALLAGVLWWHPWRPRVTTAPAAVAAVDAPARAPSPTSQAETVAAPVAVSAPPASVASPLPDPPGNGVGRTRLRLMFLADSWVDVHDAAGDRVFAGNGKANNVRSMSAMGPLRVYIKSASSVHVDVNNHAVVVGPQFIVDDVAHFAAGADGVLRRDPHFAPSGAAAPAAARPRG